MEEIEGVVEYKTWGRAVTDGLTILWLHDRTRRLAEAIGDDEARNSTLRYEMKDEENFGVGTKRQLIAEEVTVFEIRALANNRNKLLDQRGAALKCCVITNVGVPVLLR